MTRVVTIIVNYRTPSDVTTCLRSLEASRFADAGWVVTVVDNGSPDDSACRIGAAIDDRGWDSWVKLMPLSENAGFAAGNNAAIESWLGEDDSPEYFLLLNPDTIADANAVRALVGFLDDHPKAGIVGSRLEDEAGRLTGAHHRMLSPWREFKDGAWLRMIGRACGRTWGRREPPRQPEACGWVSGASMMVRREVFEKVGLFDAGFFLYFEEVDLCRRAAARGWEIWHVPASRVCHIEGRSTGIGDVRRRRARFWYESRRRFFVKSYGVGGLLLADCCWSIGQLSLAIRHLFRLGRSFEPRPRWFALDLVGGDLLALLTGRLWQLRREHS